MESFVGIGTTVDAVKAAKDAVMEILCARADQKTIRLALRAFMGSVQPKDITISNCTFSMEMDSGEVGSRK